jgi:hypothetical protein
MTKPITLNKVEHSMLEQLAKHSRLKPEIHLSRMIKEAYEKLK